MPEPDTAVQPVLAAAAVDLIPALEALYIAVLVGAEEDVVIRIRVAASAVPALMVRSRASPPAGKLSPFSSLRLLYARIEPFATHPTLG